MGSFQLLAIINKAAMNIVEHVSLLHAGESSGYMPRSGIIGSSGSVMPSFLRNHQTNFQSGCTILAVEQCSSFSTSLPTPAVSCVFNLRHSDWCEVKAQCCFDLHFPND